MRLLKPDFTKQELAVFDSSRGLLALLVVIAHIVQVVWCPVIGLGVLSTLMSTVANVSVVIFFFLSGVLITYSATNLTDTVGFNYKRFFVNRLTRIYPTLIFSLLLVFVLVKLFPFFNGGSIDIKKLPADVYLVRDNYFVTTFQIAKTITLLITNIINVNGPMWSLFIEWWLYISAMFLFIAIDKIGKQVWIRCLSFIIGLLPLIYIYRCFHVSGLFYIAIWFLGAAFTLVIYNKKMIKTSLLISAALITIIIILIKGLVILNINKADPLYFGVVQLLCSALYLNFFMDLKFLKSFRFFAPFSYTLYLIHFPIVLFIFAVLRIYLGNNLLFLTIESVFILITVLIVSYISAKATEDKKFFRKFFKGSATMKNQNSEIAKAK